MTKPLHLLSYDSFIQLISLKLIIKITFNQYDSVLSKCIYIYICVYTYICVYGKLKSDIFIFALRE
jgi:hypothetical protein